MRNNLFNYISILIVYLGVGYFTMERLRTDEPFSTLSYVGLVLMVPSLIAITIARFQLGSAFTASAQANHLVTTGIYRRIRNPIYLFSIPFIAGFLLFLGFSQYLPLVAIVIVLQIRRARKESRVLKTAFGDSYRKYRKETWI
jgi:protein-S-isoprenylcysteine O-methyltransferase Ste14